MASAYEFLRNSALDANNFFSNARGVPLASFKRSQFGGVIGGPIVKDKTFFLGSYEGLRQRSFSQRTATVPTLLERSGDFRKRLQAPGGRYRSSIRSQPEQIQAAASSVIPFRTIASPRI